MAFQVVCCKVKIVNVPKKGGRTSQLSVVTIIFVIWFAVGYWFDPRYPGKAAQTSKVPCSCFCKMVERQALLCRTIFSVRGPACCRKVD